MWDASDDALLAGYGTGDAAAAAVFVRRFQRRVYGLALTIVGDDGRAADVAQEAFVRAWRHAGSFDPRRGTVIAWLLTITRNLAIDSLRVTRARPAEGMDVAELTMVSDDPTPDDAALLGEDVGRLTEALRALPEPQRRAVVLAAMGGRTAQEISELDDIPLGTAKTRIRTGLIRLREALSEGEEVDRD